MSYRSTVNAPYLGRGMGRFGSLGDNSTDPNCVAGMPYDVNGDPCIVDCMAQPSNPICGPAPSSGTVYTAFGTEEGAAPGSGGSYAGVPNPSPAAVSKFPSTPQLPAGPSPRVAVPLSTAIPGSVGLWFSNSSLIAGVPNWEVLGGVLAVVSLLSGVLGGKRRRR